MSEDGTFCQVMSLSQMMELRGCTLMTSSETGGWGYLKKATLGDRGGGGVLPKGDIIYKQWDYQGRLLQTSENVI